MKPGQAATPVALVVLAAGAAAYAYLADRQTVSDVDRAARRSDVFPSFRVEDVTRIEIETRTSVTSAPLRSGMNGQGALRGGAGVSPYRTPRRKASNSTASCMSWARSTPPSASHAALKIMSSRERRRIVFTMYEVPSGTSSPVQRSVSVPLRHTNACHRRAPDPALPA